MGPDENQTLLVRAIAVVFLILVVAWVCFAWTGRDFTLPDLFSKIVLGVILAVIYAYYKKPAKNTGPKRTKVLVIEDSPQQQNLIRWRLGRVSDQIFDLTICSTAEDALALLQQTNMVAPPDMIILDLGLPKMSGVEFLNIIKCDFELSRIPVIILTSSRRSEVGAQVLANCCYFLERGNGGTVENLVQCINSCLSGNDRNDDKKRILDLEEKNEMMRRRIHDQRDILSALAQSQTSGMLSQQIAHDLAEQARKLIDKESSK